MKTKKTKSNTGLVSETDLIFKQWINEIHRNPRFAQDTFSKHPNLESNAKVFLNQLLNEQSSREFEITTDTINEHLTLWHHLLRKQSMSGFSTKDIVMMIFSLKSTVTQLTEEKKYLSKKSDYKHIGRILDFLGLLTFELYSAEKERLITNQQEQISYLQTHNSHLNLGNLIGESPQMKAIYKAIGLVLENDITVMLEGESGTGKDLIATVIHKNSKRKNQPFVIVNCGAIPKDLVESELFGFEKGAFTGADQQKIGKFELADNGTLFLDEIGELPMDTQAKLLRVLQNREIERVGGRERIPIDVRIIAATHRDLKTMVTEGTFRHDLYYRLNVYPVTIPKLSERKEDIVPLATFFIKKYAEQFNTSIKSLSNDAITFLQHHPWEGNIRELENLIQRAVILSQNGIITSTTLQMEPGKPDPHIIDTVSPAPSLPYPIVPLDDVEKKAIENAIHVEKGNLKQTAEKLGISRTTLYNKLKKYNITITDTPSEELFNL